MSEWVKGEESRCSRFLRSEFHLLTLQATVQRSGLYRESATQPQRRALHGSLRDVLDGLSSRYRGQVLEEDHFRTIQGVSETLSSFHVDILNPLGFRIGLAQKAVNLFLKYLWCAGDIAMPPHCPFDAVAMKLLPAPARVPWTRISTLDEYRTIVSAAHSVAAGEPLAVWELRRYERPSSRQTRAKGEGT